MNLSCDRCGKVLALEVTVDGTTYSSAPDDLIGIPDEFEVDVPRGRLLAICVECTTPREAVQEMMRLAAKTLEINEEYLANMAMVCERIPALRDNAEMKASVAKARERATEARAQLQELAALTEDDLEDE